MKIAVITGASSGMGREFVRRIDSADVYDEIWVIARRRERLEALAAETNAVLRILALDLTKEESIDTYKSLLEKENPSVSVLVNCSGFGKFGAFADCSLEDYYDMIDLNVKALVAMTYVTLPYMAPGGQIYQIDSLSAFQPVPYINVYGATKAFVLSFSRALNAEVQDRGIRVMAVCPGWVRTEFFDHAVNDDTIKYYNKFFEPEEVVKTAMKDMKKGKDVSVCGFSVKAQVLAVKFLPHKTVMRIWLKQQQKL
ncbi:MAG: SDR family NAD(P)-dependent oxidoreductase [Ruminococcaceae bacterium]|nr:SDR family NAD(P)-dependent oxidoreductase [Oscillospiraceae bacterium]